jgi:hypothetical protein
MIILTLFCSDSYPALEVNAIANEDPNLKTNKTLSELFNENKATLENLC